jgi:hypothetical protein
MSKKAKETQESADEASTPVHPVDISFKAPHVKTEKDKDNTDIMTVKVTDPTNFLTSIMQDDLLKEFLNDLGSKRFLAKIIGVKGLLATYDKKEVLDEITWQYVEEYFFDHMDQTKILNYIGWEKVQEHFKDKIQAGTTSKNDINTSNGPSILEALNESEGKNS